MSRALSPRSSIAVLKQDAKRWLAAVHRGDADARARLADAWPTAPGEPVLRDIQHALAREYGMRDWKTLTDAVEALTLDRQTHDERVRIVLTHGWDGDPALARRIVQRFPVIARDSLFTAAACGDRETVARLLTRTPTLATAVDPHRGWTALAHVAYGRLDPMHALEIARLLLDAGADPTFRFDDGWGNPFTVITGAIGLGEGAKASHPQARALVELLIARGADPYDTQALYNSSIVGDDVTWTELLWTHSVAADRTTAWSIIDGPSLGGRVKVGTLNYLLGNAVANNHIARATWLVSHGASATTVHAYSGQPVHTEAVLAGFTGIATLLESHGARAETLRGERALLAALMRGDEPDVRARVAASPSLLHGPRLLIAAAKRRNVRALTLLIELGAPVNAVDHDGATALHWAVEGGSHAAVDALLNAGADLEARDGKWQDTPMSWAVALGRASIAEQLAPLTRDVRALARTGRLDRLETVLRDDPALARELRSRGDRPTALFCLPDDDDVAADVVRVLLAHGADVAVRDTTGRSAAHVARVRGLDAAAEAMERRDE
jgi:uncharacterized protein